MISSIVKVVRGIIKLRGHTDNTIIGNAVDAIKTAIQGGDGQYVADVILKNNRKALVTDASVTVEQIFGYDDFADTWFQILTTGVAGATWRIQIAAGTSDTTSPDRDPAAVDLTYTVLVGDVGDEIKLRDNIIAMLNANATFNQHWKAAAVKDNTIVHISSKYIGEFGERMGAPWGFNITVSDAATFSYMSSDNIFIKRRGKQNSGIRDPRDKRLVTVGISGEVQAVPGAVGDLYLNTAKNNNGAGSASLLVNGNLTPSTTNTFIVPADATKDIFIEELRFYGNANGIKFGQFLGQNANLTNGIKVEIRSDEQITILPVIKSTDDFKHDFAWGQGQGFQLHIQAGRDDFMASFTFSATFPIRKAGTFVTGDDYIKVYVQDNLTAGIQVLEFIVRGFRKEV